MIEYLLNPTFTVKPELRQSTYTNFKMYTSTLASSLLLALGVSAQFSDYEGSCKDMSFHQITEGSESHGWALEGVCYNETAHSFDFSSLHIGDCVGIDAGGRLYPKT